MSKELKKLPYTRELKYLKKSEFYKNVYIQEKKDGTSIYLAKIVKNKMRYSSNHFTEREAALAIDKYLITINEEPINILKKVVK